MLVNWTLTFFVFSFCLVLEFESTTAPWYFTKSFWCPFCRGNKWCHRANPLDRGQFHCSLPIGKRRYWRSNALYYTFKWRCRVGFLIPTWFQNLDFVFWFLNIFQLTFWGLGILYCVVSIIYMLFSMFIQIQFYFSCIGCYIHFFALNLLLLSIDIFHWNLKVYISFLCMFWFWFELFGIWALNCVGDWNIVFIF